MKKFICLCLVACRKDSLVDQIHHIVENTDKKDWSRNIQNVLSESSFDENKELDLSYVDKFKDFITGKNDSWICYYILENGNVRKYKFTNTHLYVENLDGTQGYEREINDLKYDQYGYFSYHIGNDPYKIENGIPAYGFIKINAINEKCKVAYKKYIEPISYHCNNLRTVNFDETSLSKLNFNDLFEYLYEMDNHKPLYVDEFEDKTIMLEKWIPSTLFEDVILKYFKLTKEELRLYASYDVSKDAYPYFVPTCRPSHFEQPEIYGEVISVNQKGNQLILEINAINYLEGIDKAYSHIVEIELLEDGFRYVSNKIVENKNNHITTYDYTKIPNKFSTC